MRLTLLLPHSAVVIAAMYGCIVAGCSGGGRAGTTTQPTGDSVARGDEAQPSPEATSDDAPRKADALKNEGNFEAAIDAYAEIADTARDPERQAARLEQARLLTRTGRAAEARTVLEQYLGSADDTRSSSAAQLMLARTLDEAGSTSAALSAYDRYIAAAAPAADFARSRRAVLLARSGDVRGASAAAEASLQLPMPPTDRAQLLFDVAEGLDRAGALTAALPWYERAKSAPNGDSASATARIGGIHKRLGDAAWTGDYFEVVRSYPASAVAPELLDELDAAHVPVNDFARGVVEYRAYRNASARASLSRATAAGDHLAEATYYLAALDEWADDDAAATDRYARAYALDPRSPVATDALWWRARLLDRDGRFSEAGTLYGVIASQSPASEWASEASFREALARYRDRKYADAAKQWEALAARTSGDDALRARFWQARALIDAGDAAGKGRLRAVLTEAPSSFYGLRAAVLLGDSGRDAGGESLVAARTDWRAIDRYVESATPYVRDLVDEPLADPRWVKGNELDAAGLHDAADAAFSELIARYDGKPRGLVLLARNFEQDGRTSLAARTADRLIDSLRGSALAAPPDLFRAAYPAAFADLISNAAAHEQISPLLLIALVRQESFYDGDAGSSAGALGLTQVIPQTGASIARSLGRPDFAADDLYRPKVSLEFGAHYLAEQFEAFRGDAYRALAAYNGGPGTATGAADEAGDDEDLFVESLEFSETRTYVRRVMEHYARYRQLYADLPAPSLPD